MNASYISFASYSFVGVYSGGMANTQNVPQNLRKGRGTERGGIVKRRSKVSKNYLSPKF